MTAPKKKARVRATKVEPTPQLDRAKLRDALRTIGDESVFYMLDEAIDLLPPDKLAKLVGQYIQLERLRPDAGADATKRSLLEDVKAFDTASRAGKYYVSFDVNSKNYTETSTGTRAFMHVPVGQLLFDRVEVLLVRLSRSDGQRLLTCLRVPVGHEAPARSACSAWISRARTSVYFSPEAPPCPPRRYPCRGTGVVHEGNP